MRNRIISFSILSLLPAPPQPIPQNYLDRPLDSGVLISAYQGNDEISRKALSILNDENRQFLASAFVKLEVLSKAIYHQQTTEVDFYETFLESCSLWADDFSQIIPLAQEIASRYGLNALDALHIASAIWVKADEFITTEKSTKPLHRVTEITLISLAN